MSAGSIDRVAPTRRPEGKNAGTQRWRNLLFMHWEVDSEALREALPPELALDLYDGKAYVGVVPFAMQKVRPAWLPKAFALDFLETNVRVYVTHKGRPGVYFFSLEAASRLAVTAARTGWGLPYHFASMQMTERGTITEYVTKRRSDGAGLSLEYQLGKFLETPEPGSLEFFLLERYLLFSKHRGRMLCGQVHHQPYPAQHATVTIHSESLIAAAGLARPDTPPPLVHYASGVDVEVFGLVDTHSGLKRLESFRFSAGHETFKSRTSMAGVRDA